MCNCGFFPKKCTKLIQDITHFWYIFKMFYGDKPCHKGPFCMEPFI